VLSQASRGPSAGFRQGRIFSTITAGLYTVLHLSFRVEQKFSLSDFGDISCC
jgi:hypothetical protein